LNENRGHFKKGGKRGRFRNFVEIDGGIYNMYH